MYKFSIFVLAATLILISGCSDDPLNTTVEESDAADATDGSGDIVEDNDVIGYVDVAEDVEDATEGSGDVVEDVEDTTEGSGDVIEDVEPEPTEPTTCLSDEDCSEGSECDPVCVEGCFDSDGDVDCSCTCIPLMQE